MDGYSSMTMCQVQSCHLDCSNVTYKMCLLQLLRANQFETKFQLIPNQCLLQLKTKHFATNFRKPTSLQLMKPTNNQLERPTNNQIPTRPTNSCSWKFPSDNCYIYIYICIHIPNQRCFGFPREARAAVLHEPCEFAQGGGAAARRSRLGEVLQARGSNQKHPLSGKSAIDNGFAYKNGDSNG